MKKFKRDIRYSTHSVSFELVVTFNREAKVKCKHTGKNPGLRGVTAGINLEGPI